MRDGLKIGLGESRGREETVEVTVDTVSVQLSCETVRSYRVHSHRAFMRKTHALKHDFIYLSRNREAGTMEPKHALVLSAQP